MYGNWVCKYRFPSFKREFFLEVRQVKASMYLHYMCRVLNGEKRKKDKPNAGIEPATLGYTRVDKSLETVNINSTNALFSIFTPRSTD